MFWTTRCICWSNLSRFRLVVELNGEPAYLVRTSSEIFTWAAIVRFWIFWPLVFGKHSHYIPPRVYRGETGVLITGKLCPCVPGVPGVPGVPCVPGVPRPYLVRNLHMGRNRSFLNILTSGLRETLPLHPPKGLQRWNWGLNREPKISVRDFFFTSVRDTPVLRAAYVA